MLSLFGPDVWVAEGPCVDVAGFHYPTRMAALRLTDGRVALWSPIAATEDLIAAVGNLGPVAWIIAPNHVHHLALPAWITAFPEAKLFAAPRLQAKRPDLRIDRELDGAPVAEWGEALKYELVRNALLDEVVLYHAASKTVIFTDLIQQFPLGWFKGWRGVIARLDRMVDPLPQVPRKFRLGFTRRREARAVMARILAWPAERLILAHGALVTENVPQVLRAAFAFLKIPK